MKSKNNGEVIGTAKKMEEADGTENEGHTSALFGDFFIRTVLPIMRTASTSAADVQNSVTIHNEG